MAFMPLPWMVLIALVVCAVINGGGTRRGPARGESPEEIPDRCFVSSAVDACAGARERLAARGLVPHLAWPRSSDA
jgi:hypothetical protein